MRLVRHGDLPLERGYPTPPLGTLPDVFVANLWVGAVELRPPYIGSLFPSAAGFLDRDQSLRRTGRSGP